MMISSFLNLRHNAAVSTLSPNQRWQAARWFNETLSGQDRFIMMCGAVLIVLCTMFIVVTIFNSIKRRRKTNRIFLEYADKRGLSSRERHILMNIAVRARLRMIESIFTMGDVFDRGATQMIRAAIASHGAKKSRYINAELSILRDKLGFRKRGSTSTDLVPKPGKPSSRVISKGRKLYITSLETNDFFEVETVVVENNQLELYVRLSKNIECEPGDSLCARYYFGAPVWEFDTSVIRVQDNILILSHSDDVRYINRRRFLRVPINEPAYIAAFPFTQDISDDEIVEQEDKNDSSEGKWGPPEFIRADLTEIAGPGLRLVAPIEVKVGDRVAVIMKLNREMPQDLKLSGFDENNNSGQSRIIKNIGIVRHTEPVEKGLSIALELTGLSESNISEMVRVTNEASISSKKRIKTIQSFGRDKTRNWEYVSETVIR